MYSKSSFRIGYTCVSIVIANIELLTQFTTWFSSITHSVLKPSLVEHMCIIIHTYIHTHVDPSVVASSPTLSFSLSLPPGSAMSPTTHSSENTHDLIQRIHSSPPSSPLFIPSSSWTSSIDGDGDADGCVDDHRTAPGICVRVYEVVMTQS